MKFKEEIDEIKDALNSFKYYQDLFDHSPSNPEIKKTSVEYAVAKIKTIESIQRKLEN